MRPSGDTTYSAVKRCLLGVYRLHKGDEPKTVARKEDPESHRK